jgi:hypothetical protein
MKNIKIRLKITTFATISVLKSAVPYITEIINIDKKYILGKRRNNNRRLPNIPIAIGLVNFVEIFCISSPSSKVASSGSSTARDTIYFRLVLWDFIETPKKY